MKKRNRLQNSPYVCVNSTTYEQSNKSWKRSARLGTRLTRVWGSRASCSYFTPNRFWEQNPTVLQSRRGSNFTLTHVKKLRDFSIWWTLADYKNTGLNCLVVLTGFSRYCREPPFSFCLVSRWSAFLFILVQVSIDCHFKAWTRTKLLSNHSRISYDRHSSSVRIGFFPIKVIHKRTTKSKLVWGHSFRTNAFINCWLRT